MWENTAGVIHYNDTMNEARYCEHCDPYVADSRHIVEKIDMFLAPLTEMFSALEAYLRRLLRIPDTVFLKVLLRLGVLREVESRDDDASLYNRSLVVVREARKRGIAISTITFRGKGIDVYSLERRGRRFFFRALPYLVIDRLSPEAFDNKAALKQILEARGLPHPRGASCTGYRSARRLVLSEIGFPVVVKPLAESLSKHVTSNVWDEAQLAAAVAVAKRISARFVVEEHIAGDVYRITVLDGDVVAACRREPPHIIGDGMRSVQELIAAKNSDPHRGSPRQKNYTLRKIIISPRTSAVLASQGVGLGSIPDAGQRVYLHDKLVLACGADIVDVTDVLHPANKELFSAVGKLCTVPLIGIDFIVPEISKPHYEQNCGIIEINSVPYIDMHHYPTIGAPRDVAARLWDYCLSHSLAQRR